jgi:hypothetical protein
MRRPRSQPSTQTRGSGSGRRSRSSASTASSLARACWPCMPTPNATSGAISRGCACSTTRLPRADSSPRPSARRRDTPKPSGTCSRPSTRAITPLSATTTWSLRIRQSPRSSAPCTARALASRRSPSTGRRACAATSAPPCARSRPPSHWGCCSYWRSGRCSCGCVAGSPVPGGASSQCSSGWR